MKSEVLIACVLGRRAARLFRGLPASYLKAAAQSCTAGGLSRQSRGCIGKRVEPIKTKTAPKLSLHPIAMLNFLSNTHLPPVALFFRRGSPYSRIFFLLCSCLNKRSLLIVISIMGMGLQN